MAENSLALNQSIGSAFNQYYNWSTNSPFYMLAPPYLFQYYNTMMRTWDQWLSG